MQKRQRIGNRYVSRRKDGTFSKNVNVGRSLSADRRNNAKKTVKAGYGDKGDVKRAEESELSRTLANMERELGIDSEDYEDYGKYTNPTARLNAAISKIEREFGVNEEDYQYRGLKKDAESFGAYDDLVTETWNKGLNGTYRGVNYEISADSGEIGPDGARLVATVYFDTATKDTKPCDTLAQAHMEAKQLIDDNPPADYDAEEFGAERRRDNWFNTNYETFTQSNRKIKTSPSDYNMKCADCGRRMACVGPYTPNDKSSSAYNDFFAVWCDSCRDTPYSAESAFDASESFGADGMDFKEATKTGFGIAAGFTLFNLSLFGIAAVAGIVMSKK